MIRKVSNVEIVVPTVFAVALAIVLSTGAVYLAEIFLGPIEPVEAHQSVAGSALGAWTDDRTRPFRFSTMDAGRRR
jgi:ABC-type amino acid transport system permease subunit